MEIFWILIAAVVVVFIAKSIRTVPQQRALVIERFGKFDRTLEPGLRFIIPFIDRVSARHDLREVRKGRVEDPLIYGDDIIVVEQSGSKTMLRRFIEAVPALGVFTFL